MSRAESKREIQASANRSRVPVEEVAGQVRGELIPLGSRFSYFSLVPLTDEDVRQFLQEPLSALPAELVAELPPIEILLVPYLEKGNGRSDWVCFEQPPGNRAVWASQLARPDAVTLVLGIKDEDLADYHYALYRELSSLAAAQDNQSVHEPFRRALREELAAEVHGEVDEASWRLKQLLLRRVSSSKRETKLFRDYARQSLADTLTLYLHGICCDIDVETGPRQLPSRHLRRRLELLMSLFPPPEGYQVLPPPPRRRQ